MVPLATVIVSVYPWKEISLQKMKIGILVENATEQNEKQKQNEEQNENEEVTIALVLIFNLLFK